MGDAALDRTVARVPRWAGAALEFISRGTPGVGPPGRRPGRRPGRGAVVALGGFPGGEDRARRLARAGWVEVWDGLEGGPLATLTPLAAEAIGAEIDEAPTIVHAREEQLSGFDADGAEKPPRVASVRLLGEAGRWYAPGERRPARRMPRVRGFAPLPHAGLVAAPIAADPDDGPPPPPPCIARLLLLGAIAEPLKPRPRSKKSRSRKRP